MTQGENQNPVRGFPAIKATSSSSLLFRGGPGGLGDTRKPISTARCLLHQLLNSFYCVRYIQTFVFHNRILLLLQYTD